MRFNPKKKGNKQNGYEKGNDAGGFSNQAQREKMQRIGDYVILPGLDFVLAHRLPFPYLI